MFNVVSEFYGKSLENYKVSNLIFEKEFTKKEKYIDDDLSVLNYDLFLEVLEEVSEVLENVTENGYFNAFDEKMITINKQDNIYYKKHYYNNIFFGYNVYKNNELLETVNFENLAKAIVKKLKGELC